MSLKGWLFGDFIDYIELKSSSNDFLIWQFGLDNKEISYNAKLVVDESQIAVISVEHGIYDALAYGRYNLNSQTLPNTSNFLNWSEDHDEPFEANIYFLNRDSVELHWHTKEPILLHDRDNSIAKLDAKGRYKTHISNVAYFLNYILNEDLTIKDSATNSIVENNLVEALTHRSSSIYKLASDSVEFSYFLKSRLAHTFTKNGLILEEFNTHYLDVEQKTPMSSNEGTKRDTPKYFIIKASKPDGPYTTAEIKEMIKEEKLIPASYIWKDGLKDWAKVKELFVVE